MQRAEKWAGKFIVLDGPDGAGKGTQLDRLAADLTDAGLSVVRTRDPGGTSIGERIRTVLLDFPNRELDVRCETLLFMASRAQLVAEVIEPALAAGRTVLCDRFVSATYAYQGAAGYDVDQILELGAVATGGRWPDMTLVLDVDVEEALERKAAAREDTAVGSDPGQSSHLMPPSLDALESRPLEYHRHVRRVFLSLPRHYPARVVVVDGRGTPDQVTARLHEVLDRVDP